MEEEPSLIVQSCKFQFICNQCEKTFACKQSLTNHLRKHSSIAEAPYVCHVCFKRFFSNGSLRGHFLTHQNIKRTNCPKCNGVLYPGSFVEHSCTRLSEYNDYIFRDNKFHCPKCDASFPTREEFGSHRMSHVKAKCFTCDICHEIFYKKLVFRKHMDSHLCKKWKLPLFIDQKQVNLGISLALGLDLEPNKHVCKTCNKSYAKKKGLQAHIKTEHEETRFDCNICDKKFRHAKSLREHLDKHSNIKAFQCDQCESSFSYQSSLQNHMKLHGPKKFKCVTCDKEFASASQLKYHTRVHANDRKYVCPHCPDKRYFQKSHLTQHMNSHSERNFICELCTTEFRNKQSYNHHMNLHYNGKQFKCSVCAKEFATKYKLTKHLETH